MRRLAVLLLAFALAACTTIAKVEGEQVVNARLAVRVSAAWNKINDPWQNEPFDTWTQEGLPLDHLRLWGGVRAGEPLIKKPMIFFRAAGEKDKRVPTFRPGMPPDKLVTLFEEFYSMMGTVTVTKVEPATFAGEKGVRFEFTLARRGDDALLRGVGWVATRNNELYAATFVAPQLAFFSRLLPKAEDVVRTARIRS